MAEQTEVTEADRVVPAPEAPSPQAPFASRLQSTWSDAASWSRDALGLVGLLLLLSYLWGRGSGVWYWIDEGISLGISAQPLAEIPRALRLDGSPPLYYALLHGWTAVFGRGEAATHTLSILFALATVVAALWAGWSLYGRRTGWVAAVLAGLSPLLGAYANETRMYSLLPLLALLATATFIHCFVHGRRRYLPAFSICLALLLYTHNWSFFFLAATVVALGERFLVGPDRRRVLTDAALALGGTALLYLPWVPGLLYQLDHTGTPFLLMPTLLRVRDDLIYLVGAREAVLAFGLVGGPVLANVFQRPRSKLAMSIAASALLLVATVAIAWVYSRREPVWETRYVTVLIGPMLLATAPLLARAGRAGVTAVVIAGFFMAPIAVKTQPYRKSNVREVVEQLAPAMGDGGLVVSEFGRTPVLSYYMETFGATDLTYVESTGPVPVAGLSDQREGVRRLREAQPAAVLPPFLNDLAPGQRVLVACPPEQDLNEDAPEFAVLIVERCRQSLAVVQGDARFRLETYVPGQDKGLYPSDGYLFTKVSG